MKRSFIAQLSLLLLSTLCFGQHKKADTVFFDDFNGPKLDRSKWNVEITGTTVNDEQQAYVDSSAVLYFVHGKAAQGARNGALVIKTIYQPKIINMILFPAGSTRQKRLNLLMAQLLPE